MTLLIPRVDREVALSAIARSRTRDMGPAGIAMPDISITGEVAALGGAPIQDAQLVSLRQALLCAAAEHGYPAPPKTNAQKQASDAAIGACLHEHLDISAHEASCDGIWNYLTAAWLLDLCVWRWGWDADVDRYTGHASRGQFRRLWWREEVLGAPKKGGGYSLVPKLNEEELVAVMERPSLTRHRPVARMLVSVYLIAREQLEGFRRVDLGRQEVMRSFAPRVLRLMPFMSIEVLSDEQLFGVLVEQLDDAINALISDVVHLDIVDLVRSQMLSSVSEVPAAPATARFS